LEEPAARLSGPEPPPPPRKIGPYRIVEKIGTGGMGEIYKVVDEEGRTFALKRLARELVSTEGLARFRREATAASALEHRNVVRFIDVVEDDGRPHLVMEYLSGRTLKKYLSGKRGLEPRDVVAIALQVAEGLGAAHAKGIVHRDLKPENILITTDGTVKLLDFGISKLLDAAPALTTASDRITKTGQILGTAEYMSPEQARGETVDPRSDIFAFGCVLYEMVSGRVPFAGESVVEKISAVLKEEPEPLERLAPDVPEKLRNLAYHCLRKDAAKRPQTIREILEELR